MENSEPLPALDLEGRSLTSEEYHALTPERLELIEGYLCGSAQDRRCRALAINEGLLALVRLAPPHRWREALQRVYGPKV
jgi:hypothetical protein